MLPPHDRIPSRGTTTTQTWRGLEDIFRKNGRSEPNRSNSSTMEESWETGERDDKARRREESCYSENNGIGEVRESGKN